MRLVTERLVLREFEEGDWEALLAYQTDPRTIRYYGREWAERGPEQVRHFVGKLVEQQREEPRTNFALVITLRENGRLIGRVGIKKARPEAAEGELGCELAPDYWDKGYATEATRAIMAFGFTGLRLHRLFASTIAANAAARRVLEKLGMTLEGELRETDRLAGGWANSVIYGILEGEWHNRIEAEDF